MTNIGTKYRVEWVEREAYFKHIEEQVSKAQLERSNSIANYSVELGNVSYYELTYKQALKLVRAHARLWHGQKITRFDGTYFYIESGQYIATISWMYYSYEARLGKTWERK